MFLSDRCGLRNRSQSIDVPWPAGVLRGQVEVPIENEGAGFICANLLNWVRGDVNNRVWFR